MNSRKRLILAILLMILAISLVVACGDDKTETTDISSSGLSADLYLDEMTSADKQTFCGWYIEAFGGAGTEHACEYSDGEQMVSAGEPVVVPSLEDCQGGSHFQNHCTLGSVETCIQATDGDPCKIFELEECQPMAECLSGATADNPPANDCPDSDVRCYCADPKMYGYNTPNKVVELPLPTCFGLLFCATAFCPGINGARPPQDILLNICNQNSLCAACSMDHRCRYADTLHGMIVPWF